MQELMKGENGQLPRLLVDAVNCREMVSSVEKAPAGIRYKGETKVVFKIKKSEKLAPKTGVALSVLPVAIMQIPIFPVLRSDFCPYQASRRFSLSYFTKIARGNCPGTSERPARKQETWF